VFLAHVSPSRPGPTQGCSALSKLDCSMMWDAGARNWPGGFSLFPVQLDRSAPVSARESL
jgi:hypothetical protein